MTRAGNDPRPLVSVIIASYNYGRFLAEAIESALQQTYQPIEVIVVDDGSTDNTADVAARYPVRLIRQPNAGLAAAGRAGIRASCGEFVMRLDADDRLKPTYVEETVAVLRANASIDFVYTQVQYFGAQEGTYPIEDFDPDTLAERNYVNASAMMRRSAYESAGGYCTALGRLRCEDWDLWLSFVDRGRRGQLLARPLLEYRRHTRGSMANFNLLAVSSVRRELALVAHLQDHHPRTFAPDRLLRRLVRLPNRVRRGEVSVRFAVMLLSFYSVMLARRVSAMVHQHPPMHAMR